VDRNDRYAPVSEVSQSLFKQIRRGGVGHTVLQMHDGSYIVAIDPSTDEREAAAKVYSGGHVHIVSDAEALSLVAAGFTVDGVIGEPPVEEPPVDPPDDEEEPPEPPEVGLLSWAPPELVNPITIEVSNSSSRSLVLNSTLDYIIKITEPITQPNGVSIYSGRRVQLVGGEIVAPATGVGNARRGLYLQEQKEYLHVEGVRLSGGQLEGINFNQRQGAIVQIQNCDLGFVQGAEDSNHADVIQSWAGPRILRLDRVVARTSYQGLFLLPRQFVGDLATDTWDFRNLDISGTDEAGYLVWRDDALSISYTNVHLYKDGGALTKIGWPNTDASVVTTAPQTDILLGTPGMGYVSPGYAA
jgi:hypothetical protein